jgi:hypothetical protein
MRRSAARFWSTIQQGCVGFPPRRRIEARPCRPYLFSLSYSNVGALVS